MLLWIRENSSLLVESLKEVPQTPLEVSIRLMCRTRELEVPAAMWERRVGGLRRGEWIMRSAINF